MRTCLSAWWALPQLLASAAAAGPELCLQKATFTKWRCPTGSTVACWSSLASAPWACWGADDAPSWASGDGADAGCEKKEVPLGLPSYDGACVFSEAGDVAAISNTDTSSAAEAPVEAAPPVTTAAPKRVLESPMPLLDLDPEDILPTWEEAKVKARETLGKMSPDQKHAVLTGLGWNGDLQKWYYVGNTAPVPELGIPSLNMQDAASGFRTYWSELVGTVTCWPSGLSMAATWDPQAVHKYAKAIGKEFKGKGANGILGPSVDVHRVARNGRNFEYLSGEDPYLGSQLATAYVLGVQSQGVFSVMKHWVFNGQETNRDSESSSVDAKTAWELYYPPFQAAVDAGVSAAMCSYNRIDGQYSCSNSETLQSVLKDKMGFQGFVQSDWWATKDMGLPSGLDQEMPGTALGGGEVFFSPEGLAGQDSQRVDDAVERVLSVIYRLKLDETTPCSAPDCEEWFRKNVTSDAHASLARSLAAESIVMLQNRDNALPIVSGRVAKIAVIGAASVAKAYNPNGDGQDGGGDWAQGDYYSGGGSGHMVAGRLTTPLDGISNRAEAEGIQVVSSPTDDVDPGLQAAQEADVVIVVAATTSGESRDRDNLELDGNVGGLIEAVAAQKGQQVVVLVQSPGAFLAPWKTSVSSILAMFLGGQETGAAWADVLFGDHAPTGRLPIMVPETEDDQIPPSGNDVVEYTEGMATSYRSTFKAAWPFGYGITYTTFEYIAPSLVPCGPSAVVSARRLGPLDKVAVACVRVGVRNTGSTAGRDVVQLYVQFPDAAAHPAPLLKGFQKTRSIAPGVTQQVVLPLTMQDLSYWDAGIANWKEADSVIARVAASSADAGAPTVQLTRDSVTGQWSGPQEPQTTAPPPATPAPTAATLPPTASPTATPPTASPTAAPPPPTLAPPVPTPQPTLQPPAPQPPILVPQTPAPTVALPAAPAPTPVAQVAYPMIDTQPAEMPPTPGPPVQPLDSGSQAADVDDIALPPVAFGDANQPVEQVTFDGDEAQPATGTLQAPSRFMEDDGDAADNSGHSRSSPAGLVVVMLLAQVVCLVMVGFYVNQFRLRADQEMQYPGVLPGFLPTFPRATQQGGHEAYLEQIRSWATPVTAQLGQMQDSAQGFFGGLQQTWATQGLLGGLQQTWTSSVAPAQMAAWGAAPSSPGAQVGTRGSLRQRPHSPGVSPVSNSRGMSPHGGMGRQQSPGGGVMSPRGSSPLSAQGSPGYGPRSHQGQPVRGPEGPRQNALPRWLWPSSGLSPRGQSVPYSNSPRGVASLASRSAFSR